MPSLRDAADAARDAIRYRREVGGDVAIANSHEAFDALLAAVDERVMDDWLWHWHIRQSHVLCKLNTGGWLYKDDGKWRHRARDGAVTTFGSAMEAGPWVKAREGK